MRSGERVKCKDTIFCIQRNAHSQFISSSRGEFHGGWWRQEITAKPPIACSNLTMEALEQNVKYVKS